MARPARGRRGIRAVRCSCGKAALRSGWRRAEASAPVGEAVADGHGILSARPQWTCLKKRPIRLPTACGRLFHGSTSPRPYGSCETEDERSRAADQPIPGRHDQPCWACSLPGRKEDDCAADQVRAAIATRRGCRRIVAIVAHHEVVVGGDQELRRVVGRSVVAGPTISWARAVGQRTSRYERADPVDPLSSDVVADPVALRPACR